MRIAVLGVGLIGGSIGLAARERLDAEVAGFDPHEELLSRAEQRGAIGSRHRSVAEACRHADIVFCASPVAALPELAAEALDATADGCAVTDVGSVKRQVIVRLGEEPRFVGGHPIAGAETSGVEHARPDLFEGARWYLTPTSRTEGLLYDRLQRAIAEMGARPQAIDAETHDRVMATVSHLPHALANVLVSEAANALAEESERLPEVGPSFRDATRVAGANPGIWADILAENREAVAAGMEEVAARLGEAAAMLRSGDRRAVGDWHRRAGERRRELLEAGLGEGPLHELRVSVPNRPGIVAEIALVLGRAQVNIEDMALYPAADMRSGAVSLYVAGDAEVKRAGELIRELGHAVSEVAR